MYENRKMTNFTARAPQTRMATKISEWRTMKSKYVCHMHTNLAFGQSSAKWPEIVVTNQSAEKTMGYRLLVARDSLIWARHKFFHVTHFGQSQRSIAQWRNRTLMRMRRLGECAGAIPKLLPRLPAFIIAGAVIPSNPHERREPELMTNTPYCLIKKSCFHLGCLVTSETCVTS